MSDEQMIAKFISDKAYAAIGHGCVVGASAIVFEFIGADGRMGHAVLRQKGAGFDETLDLLMAATETMLEAQEKKFPYDEADPDDL